MTEITQTEPAIYTRKTEHFLDSSKRWVLMGTGMLIIVQFCISFIAIWQAAARNFLHPITLTTLMIQGIATILFYIFGMTQLKNRIGNLCIGIAMYGTGDTILKVTENPSSYTLAVTFWWTVVIIGGLALIFAIFRILVMTWFNLVHRKTYIHRLKQEVKRIPKLTYILIALTASSAILTAVTTNKQFGVPITIQPQDYRIEIRMWANYDPAWYQNHPNGTQMLDQLNKYSVIIQNAIFNIRDSDNISESFSPKYSPADANTTATMLNWFKIYYPKIRFQYYAYGLGFGSCGNYEGSIYTAPMLKRFVDVCRDYNLTNVVGVYTDWEGPLRTAPNYANETRNGWHQALWTDAFAYVRAYFPNWVMSCCYPDSTYWDNIDDDADIQYYDRYNVFMPMWDDYGPMVYRSCDTSGTPEESGTSWSVYAHAKAQLDGGLKGDLSKASMWLGCTGCGAYDNNSIVKEHGKPIDIGESKGFDAFARDVLILKHFGYPSFSIFHGIDNFDETNKTTGFFHQYGFANALDRLDTLINGGNSTKLFTIWSDGSWNPSRNIALDWQLNFDRLMYIPIMVLIGLGGFILAFYDQILKKLKNLRPNEMKVDQVQEKK